MKSIFIDKKSKPSPQDLKKGIGSTSILWQQLVDFTKEKYPNAMEEWNFASERFGWSFRIKDKKRVLIYFLPRDQFFKVAFVFGQKAVDIIQLSKISDTIKKELMEAKVYAEGRGIRIEVKDKSMIRDIEELISIKIGN